MGKIHFKAGVCPCPPSEIGATFFNITAAMNEWDRLQVASYHFVVGVLPKLVEELNILNRLANRVTVEERFRQADVWGGHGGLEQWGYFAVLEAHNAATSIFFLKKIKHQK